MTPPAHRVDTNRQCRYDFTLIDLEKRIGRWRRKIEREDPQIVEDIQPIVDRIGRAVSRIRQRGGDVVLVRMPTNGERRDHETALCPRALCWDVLVASTEAITIHVDDFEVFADFECPDESHLDYRDAGRFTRELARIVNQRLAERTSAQPSAHRADGP